jgi:hypothetical protein
MASQESSQEGIQEFAKPAPTAPNLSPPTAQLSPRREQFGRKWCLLFTKADMKAVKPKALLLMLRDINLNKEQLHREVFPDVPLSSKIWNSIMPHMVDLARNVRRRMFLSEDYMIPLVRPRHPTLMYFR